MNLKKFISGVSALAIAASAFAGITAMAAAGDAVADTKLYIGGATDTSVVSNVEVGAAESNAGITLYVDDSTVKYPTNRVSTSQTNNTGLITLASAYDITGTTNQVIDGHPNDIKITWTSYYTGNTYGSNGQRRLEFLDSNGTQVLPSVIDYNWGKMFFNYNNSTATAAIGTTTKDGVNCEINIKTNSSGTRMATFTVGETTSDSFEVKGDDIAQVRLWIGNVNDSGRVLYVKDLTFEASEPSVDVTYYPVLVKSSVGGVTFVDQAEVEEGTTINYTFPKYLTDSNNRVIAYTDATSFKGSVTASETSGDVTVPYTAYDGVAIEVEPKTANVASENTNLSNCDSYRAFNKNNIASITIPEDGEYQVSANIFSGNVNAARTFYAKVGEKELMNVSIDWSVNGVKVVSSDKFMLQAGDVISFTSSDTQVAVDYILVEKTGEYVAPEVDGTVEVVETYNDADKYEGVATALTATFDITGVTVTEVTVTPDGDQVVAEAQTQAIPATTDTTLVYGIVVDKIVTASAFTAVAK